jgi:transposase
MRTSPDTLLRLMRDAPPAVQLKAPQVLGVDDWAIRRGCRYGTILCDLQLHKPIELLPERSSQCLVNWLVDHPGTHIISRDRGGDYARGAAAGAPEAIQVADRWHLLHNLTEAFQRALDRQHVLIIQAAKAVAQAAGLPAPTLAPAAESATRLPSPPSQPTRAQQRHEERRARRLARYEDVKKLHAQGLSLRHIAVELKLDRDTVRRFVRAGQFPERARRAKPPTELDRFMDYLRLRWQQGCLSSKQLYRELKDRGYGGSWYTVRRRVSAWREPKEAAHVPGRQPAAKRARIWRPSSRTVDWLLLDPDRADSTQQQAFLAELHRLWPELGETVALVHEFRRLLRDREHESLDAWVQLAQEKSIPVEITNFARYLQKDWAAVVEAVKGIWNNGQVEGQINRLKLIKRQMYGRANFDLLRQRVLHAS